VTKYLLLVLLLAGRAFPQSTPVAFGASGYCGAGNKSCSVTTSGSGIYLAAELSCNGTPAGVSAAWGSSNLTAGAAQTGGATAYGQAFYGPVSAGTNTLAVSIGSGGGTCNVSWVYYTGVGSLVQAQATSCTSVAGSNDEPCTDSITTTSTNGWVVDLVAASGAGIGVNSPAVLRQNYAAFIADMGPVSPGVQSLTLGMCGYCGAAVFKSTMLELAPVTPCSVTTASLPNASKGVLYSATLATQNCAGPSFSVASGLPPGLAINSSSGTISGTPTTAGVYPFTVNVADTNGNSAPSLSITVTQGPVISAQTCTANSPSSVYCTWTTDVVSDSRVLCSTVTGGPYTYDSDVINPVQTSPAATYWGVTSHAMPSGGVPPITGQAFCVVQSTATNGISTTSAEIGPMTLPSAPNSVPVQVVSMGPMSRLGDQNAGVNGAPVSAGQYCVGDNVYSTWADDGKNYAWVSCLFGMGEALSYSGAGPTMNPVVTSDQGMYTGFSNIGTGWQNGVNNLILNPYVSEWFGSDPISVNGSMYIWIYDQAGTGGHPPFTWQNLLKTTDHWTSSITPVHNVGPSTTAITNMTCSSGMVTATSLLNITDLVSLIQSPGQVAVVVAGASGTGVNGIYGVSNATGTTISWPQSCSGWSWTSGGTINVYQVDVPTGPMPNSNSAITAASWVKCDGKDYQCTKIAGMDGYVYFFVPRTNSTLALCRMRVENMQAQLFSKIGCYKGNQNGDDGLYSTNWDYTSNKVTNSTAMNPVPFSYRANGRGGVFPQMIYIPTFNRFVLAYEYPAFTDSWGGGTGIYDVGPYPWSPITLLATYARNVDVYPGATTQFPRWIASTQTAAGSTVSIDLGFSGGNFNKQQGNPTTNSQDIYKASAITFGARPGSGPPSRQQFGNAQNTEVANGLDLAYDFDVPSGSLTLPNKAPSDATQKYAWTAASNTTGIWIDKYGTYDFTSPSVSSSGGLPTGDFHSNVAITTPYAQALASSTVLTCFGHYPTTLLSAPAAGAIALQKNGDLKIAWDWGPNWTVTYKGTSLGDVSIPDNSIGCIVIRASQAGTSDVVTVYNTAGIGTSLPLAPALGPTTVASGQWGTNPLVLGDAANSFWGIMSLLRVWNRDLSDTELVTEMTNVRQILQERGIVLANVVNDPMTVTVSGVTNTQAVLQYTAPDTTPCSVAVSQSPGLAPLAHDVDPSIFAGANLDNRAGSISSGTSRTFVFGQRTAQKGSDGYFHSRAAQAASTYYYQVTCDSASAAGTFTTSNIALGNTYNEDLPASPAATAAGYYVPAGQYAWPQFLNWNNSTGRSEGVVDPQTGMLLQRVTMPQDYPTANLPAGDHSFSQALNPSGNWTNSANILANDSSYASYSGTTSDWLVVTDQNLTNGNNYPIDAITLSVLGWCSGTCAGESVDVAITVNGVTPWPNAASAQIQNVTLGTSALPATFVVAGSTTPIMAAWTPAGMNPLNGAIPNNNNVLSDMIKRTGTVNVDGSGNVTWGSGNLFYPNWTAGSLITISASLCTITSSTVTLESLTITPSACSPALSVPVSGASYSANNFGFMIRKHSSSAADSINLQYAKYTVAAEGYISWPASGSPDVCSDTLTQNTSTGDLGYHCIIGGTVPVVYWIDHTTGVASYLGAAQYAAQSGPNGWQSGYCNNASTTLLGTSSTAPEAIYCTGTDNSGNEIVLSCSMSSNNTAGNLSFSCTNLTPAANSSDLLSLISNFTSGYTPAFSRTVFPACGISGIQGGNLVMNCVESQQDTLGWVVVFNPTLVSSAAGCVGGSSPGCVIAAQSTWAVAPCRWCVLHTLFQTGQASTNTAWVAGKYTGTTPGQAGGGAFVSTVTSGSLTATPSIAAGTGGCPSGSAGCDQVVVDGEPCNPSPVAPDPTGCPKNSAWGYIQSSMVGDLFTVEGGNSELLKLVSKTGTGATTWLLQRAYPSGGFPSTPQSYSGNLVLQAFCGAAPPYGGMSWTWNYIADPHGLNSGGTTIQSAYYYDHPVPRPSFVVGADGWYGNSSDPIPGNGYAVLNTSGFGFPNTYEAISPAFSGVAGVTAFIESAQDHASASQDSALAAWFNDARPASTLAGLNGTATPVAGQLYKYASTTTDGDNLSNIGGASNASGINRKLQATMAFCGTQPLTDISSPAAGNVIGTTSSNSYQYCIARNAGECRSGSSQGDIYLNCPYTAPVSGSSYGCFSQNDMCVFNTGAYLNGIAQIGYTSTDSAGLLGRTLSKGLIRQRDLDVNQNVRVLPDASWLLFRTIAVNGAEDAIMVGKLPPYPAQDSVARNTFVPVPLSLTPPSGLGVTNVIVEFGYGENGAPNQLDCTTRQDTCVVTSATIGANPFQFASEGSGGVESGLAGLPCASGCSLNIPGLAQRVLYYQVKYRNANNQVVSQTGLQISVTP